MKLKLNNSLRAALMACYALAAPIATTVSTGAIVTGVALTLLAPQAQAGVYNWTGEGANTNVSTTDNWNPSISYGSWMSTTANSILFNSNTVSGGNTVSVDFSTMNLGGVILTSDATDQGENTYQVITNSSSDRNINLGAMEADDVTTYATSGAVSGATNFILAQDFNLGGTYYWATVTLNANLNAVVAEGATFSINAKTLTAGANNAFISGGGTTTLNLTTGFTGTGSWTVSGGSTLNLVDYGANLLTTTTAGSVILNNGTVSLASGSDIVGTIGVGSGGGSIVLTDVADGETGSLTLNGTISFTDTTTTALDLSGYSVTFGEDFVFNFEGDLENDTYDLLTNFTSDTTDYDFAVSGLGYDQVASFDIVDGTIQVTIADSGAQALVWGGGDGIWSTEGAWATDDGSSATFDSGDAVTLGTLDSSAGGTVTLDGDVSAIALDIVGEGGWGIDSTEEGANHTLDVGAITVNVTGTDSVWTGADVNITNVDTIHVIDGTLYIEGGLSNVSSVVVDGEGNLGFYGNVDNVESITVAEGGSFTLGSTAVATNMGSLTISSGADVTLYASADFTSMALGDGITVDGAGVIVTSGGGAQTDSSGTWMGVTADVSIEVKDGGTLSLNTQMCMGSAELVVEGNGTLQLSGLQLGSFSSTASTVTVEAGATLEITSEVYQTSYDCSANGFIIGNWSSDNTIDIEGTMIVAGVMTRMASTATVDMTVYEGGSLVLKSGLDVYSRDGDSTKSTITVEGGGKLTVGTQSANSDAALTVTLEDKSTLQAYGAATVLNTISYADNATVNFAADSGDSLTLSNAVTGTNISANIQGEGSVSFAAGATLTALNVESGASLSLSGATVVSNSITNAGTLSLDGTLTISSTITNTDGTINIGSGTLLDITAITEWAEADGVYSYSIIDGGTINIDDSFSADISSLFTDSSLLGKQNVSFVDGVFSYTLLDGVTYTGGSLDLQVGTEVGGTEYVDGYAINFTTDDATVNLTGDVEPSSVVIADGLTVILGSVSGATLSSTDIGMGAGSTLIVDVEVLKEGSSFGVTAADSTLVYDLNGTTVTNDTRIEGFTGELVIREGTFYVNDWSTMEHSSGGAMDFTALTVEAGATFQMYGASLYNTDYDIAFTLQGGEDAASTATFSANSTTIKGDMSLSGHTTLVADGEFNIYGEVSNTDGADTDVLLKSGSGVLTVTGGMNYSGSLTMEGGTLALSAASSLGSVAATGDSTLGVTTSLTVGGTLTLTGTQDIALSTNSSITGTSISNVDLSSLAVSSSADSLTFSGTVSMSSLDLVGTDIILTADAQVTVGGGADTAVCSSRIFNETDTEINITLASGSVLSQDISLWSNTSDKMTINVTGGGTYELTGLLMRNGSANGDATLNVGSESDSDTVMHITGVDTSSNYAGLITNGGGTNDSIINVYGTLIVDSGIKNNASSDATITVYDGGTLQLNRGTYMTTYQSLIAITVGDGATLELGNSIDDSGDAVAGTSGTITFQNGSTLTGNGETYDGDSSFTTSSTTTIDYTNFAFDSGATVTIDAGAETTLSFTQKLTATDASLVLTGGGQVDFTAGVVATKLTVQDSTTLSVAGTKLESAVVLDGGSLSLTDGTLSTDISVIADGSSLSATVLNSTISLSEDVSLALSGDVTLGADFALDLSAWDLSVTDADGEINSYEVFTGLSSDISGDYNFDVTGLTDLGEDSAYDYSWSYVGGTLSLTFTEIGAWVPNTGDFTGDPDEEVTIDTTKGDNVTIAEDGDTTAGLDITGGDSVTIEGGDLTSTEAITVGSADESSTTVIIDTGVSATEGINVVNGEVEVTENGEITATDVSLAAGTSVTGSSISVSAGTDSADIEMGTTGSLTDVKLDNAIVTGAEIKMLEGASLEATQLVDTTVTVEAGKSVTLTDVAIGAGTSFTAESGLVLKMAGDTDITYDVLLAGSNSIDASEAKGSLTVTGNDYIVTNMSGTSVSVAGELVVNIILTDDELADLHDNMYNYGDKDAIAFTFTIEGVDDAEGLTSLVINIVNDDSIYYSFSDDYTVSDNKLVVNTTAAVIPEPSTSALSLLALAGLLARRRRKA